MITTWDELYENQEQRYRYYVNCKSCQDQHWTDDIHILDVEEDDFGRDVVEFICPETNCDSMAWVYKQ